MKTVSDRSTLASLASQAPSKFEGIGASDNVSKIRFNKPTYKAQQSQGAQRKGQEIRPVISPWSYRSRS